MKKMVILMMVLLSVSISGCISTQNETAVVGGDRDEHGCIGSAGYIWCETKQKCLRTWEEPCDDVIARAKKYCNVKDVAKVYVCGNNMKVVSRVPGAGFLYYRANGEQFSCPVVAPDAMSEECKMVRDESECWDVCGGGEPPKGKACPEDAKVCPDGTTVSRTGPNCEFAPCPATTPAGNATTSASAGKMTIEEALNVAEGSECAEKGTLTETYFYNENSRTWWIDLTHYEEKEGCNPACVVSETGKVEINWRCTGALLPVLSGGFCGSSTNGTCKTDDDCMKGGCSGEICQSRSEELMLATCEWKECYDAEGYDMECRCIGGGCQWAIEQPETPESEEL